MCQRQWCIYHLNFWTMGRMKEFNQSSWKGFTANKIQNQQGLHSCPLIHSNITQNQNIQHISKYHSDVFLWTTKLQRVIRIIKSLQQNNTSRSGYLDISWRRILLPMEPPAWSWRMAALPEAMTMWSSHDITWPIKECPMTGLVVAVLPHPNLDWSTEFRTAMVSTNL